MSVFHLKLSFRKSTSKNLNTVLKHCREFDYFIGEYNLEIYAIRELFEKWEHFNIVYHYTRKWSGTDFVINGVTYIDNSVFYSLQELKDCNKQYDCSCDKQGFCDASEWGCHKLKAVGRFVDESFGPYWYDYGHFTDQYTWKIDKDRIRNILTEEAKLKKLFLCPNFNAYKITSLLLRLPDAINVDGQKWQKTTKIEHGKDGPVRIPVGIVHGPESEYEEDIPEYTFTYPGFEMPEHIDNKTANELIELYKRGII